MEYVILELAKSLGVPPWELTRSLPPDQEAERTKWVVIALEVQRMRGAMKVTRG